ncbi:MAG TPA: hypothetical protein VG188_06120 [Solirubrobacteraceae bacterium]|nr:hypothetical protein [Solirubrobacteraceae bacterium]
MQFGFPRSSSALPGAGGVVRTVRMIGIVDALMKLLMQGQRLRPKKALETGILDELVSSQEGVAMLLGCACGFDRAGLEPSRLPGAGAAAERRAKPQPRAEDPRRDESGRRGRRRRVRGSSRVRSCRQDARRRRGRKLAGAGYYDYADGKRRGLWKDLKQMFPETGDPASTSLKDLGERMLFAESLETSSSSTRRDRVRRRRPIGSILGLASRLDRDLALTLGCGVMCLPLCLGGILDAMPIAEVFAGIPVLDRDTAIEFYAPA